MEPYAVRPLAPSDAAAYASVMERTTSEDRYCRFFHAVDHFDPEFIGRFVEERSDAVGFIAADDHAALGVIHGFLIGERTAELAVVVARDARGRGIGRALGSALIEALDERGWTTLVAYSLAENRPFARLAKSLGFHAAARDGAVVTWQRDVAATPAGAAV